MRLIDADALKADCEIYNAWDAQIVKAWLEDRPTIDARPVVHGHWENVHIISAGLFLRNCEDFAESKCSVCGRWTVRLARCIRDNYCPHCGADMRGENK